MSIKSFLNGARMSGVCAFIIGYFEYEHKTLLIYRPATLIFRIYLCGIVCIPNETAHTMTKCYANAISDINIMIHTCVYG